MTTLHYPPNDASLWDMIKEAEPGTTIECSDSDLGGGTLTGVNGTAEQPITLRGVGTSPVVFDRNGLMTFRNCSHVVIENFAVVNQIVLQDCTGCVVRNCDFATTEASVKEYDYFLRLLGGNSSGHSVLDNRFSGKRRVSAFLHVRESTGDRVAGNWFYDYQINEGTTNGQCIMTGDASYCMTESQCEIVGNVFEYDIAERTEIISVKSCNVAMRNNFFVNCRGAISLRLANDCEITGNQFIAEKDEPTFEDHWHDSGGVRVFGANHLITHNAFHGLAYGVYVMNGDHEDLSAGQELYARAKDCEITGNEFCESAKCIDIGGSDSTNVAGLLVPLRIRSGVNGYWTSDDCQILSTWDCASSMIHASDINNGDPPEFDEDAAQAIRDNAGVQLDEG
jgi:hypothetical protein